MKSETNAAATPAGAANAASFAAATGSEGTTVAPQTSEAVVPQALEETLAARELAYRVLHALLSQPPTRANVEVALSDVFEQALELAGAACDPAGLQQQRAAFERDPEGYTCAAADEYQRLFYAPGRLVAPPWESSWRSAERKVFQRCTLEVRDAYRAQGFRSVSVNRIPDDHVAIELCFMAQLAARAKDAAGLQASETKDAAHQPAAAQQACRKPVSANSPAAAPAPQAACSSRPGVAAAQPALAASQAFLANHLGRWVNEYATALSRASGVGLYAHIACCLRAFVQADQRWLGQQTGPAPAARERAAQQTTSNCRAQAPSPAALAS